MSQIYDLIVVGGGPAWDLARSYEVDIEIEIQFSRDLRYVLILQDYARQL